MKPFLAGNWYEDYVCSFLKARGIEYIKERDRNGNHHHWDITVPDLDLRIEVKGCQRHYKTGALGKCWFNRQRYSATVNCYAFVISEDCDNTSLYFLSPTEFKDMVTRQWLSVRTLTAKWGYRKNVKAIYPHTIESILFDGLSISSLFFQ